MHMLFSRFVALVTVFVWLGACGSTGGNGTGDGAAPDTHGALDGSTRLGDGSTSGDGLDAPRTGVDVPFGDGTTSNDGNDVVACGCGPTEICGDGYDNNCNGQVDENCPCLPGTTQRCLNGTPQPGAPLCAFGQQSCEGSGEFGTWGACTGMGSLADASSSAIACRRVVILGAPGANASSNFQTWLEHNGAVVTRTQDMATSPPLQRALLDTFDLAIIDWLQRDYTVAEANVLRDWVVAGGGLISLSGHDSGATADRQVSLLQTVGMTYVLGQAYNGPATILAGTPINATGSSFTVTFNGGMQVTTTSAFTGSGQQIVATVPTHVTVGMVGNLGAGHLFIFGDEWIEFDSEWSTMMTIPQLWFSTVNAVNPNPGHAPMTNCE